MRVALVVVFILISAISADERVGEVVSGADSTQLVQSAEPVRVAEGGKSAQSEPSVTGGVSVQPTPRVKETRLALPGRPGQRRNLRQTGRLAQGKKLGRSVLSGNRKLTPAGRRVRTQGPKKNVGSEPIVEEEEPSECSPVTCELACPNGFLSDSNGCLTCECFICAQPLCEADCPDGFQTDARGCATCQCKSDSCPPVGECDETCQVEKDPNSGCDICVCVDEEPIKCTPVTCDLACPNGFLTDENGCLNCECQSDSCPPVGECDETCQVDKDPTSRCDVCVCTAPPSCSEDECTVECSNGRVTNSQGCPTCECLPTCVKPQCEESCDGGYKIDENGCETCECDSEPIRCPVLTCTQGCPRGYISDENGCPTCECFPSCPEFDAGSCPTPCLEGFRRDRDGCTTCECVEPPTKPGQCPSPVFTYLFGEFDPNSNCEYDLDCRGSLKCCSNRCIDPSGLFFL